MKRVDVVKELLKEGFTENTLASMSDKNILSLSKIVLEQGAFNDAGEPMMTHQQFNDYSEPSEPDYPYDDGYENDNFDISRGFMNEMKQNNIFVETFNGKEYFIRCNDVTDDFVIYFDDESIKIYGPHEDDNGQVFNYVEAIDYTLNNKDKFYTFDESIKEREREERIDAQDKHNNRMEMGNLGENKMKRTDIIEKLLKEGFTEKTLSRMSDKNLLTISKTVLGEQAVAQFSVSSANPKFKEVTTKLQQQGVKNINVTEEKPSEGKDKSECAGELDEKKHIYIEPIKPIKKISPIKLSKFVKGVKPIKPIKSIKPIKEDKEVEEWILNLAENNFSTLTSKKDIMEIITRNIQEVSHNGIPEFMTYDAIKGSGAGSPQTEPGAPEPEVIPDTPTRPEKSPRKTPYTPGPGPDHKPKAFRNAGSPQTEPGAPEPEVIPDTPTRPEKSPRKTPYTPGPGPDHKPKAFKK